MRTLATILIAALAVTGLWGPDSLANAQDDCVSQGAVAAGQTALAADCEVLVAIRDTLAGTATLNWAADTPIEDWDGINVDGTPLRVVQIELVRSGLTGSIPGELGDLDGLTGLWLWENQLTGSIPGELGDLHNLKELHLDWNELTGEIPTEFGNLSNLTSLSLCRNQLTGKIPNEFGNLSNLTSLSLCSNQLTGTIPRELGNLSDLTALDFSWNDLTGEIPTEFGRLSNLEVLGLFGNHLSGPIPKELGSLSNLIALFLEGNELSGEIPNELGDLSNLVRLFLGWNNLSGEIPSELGKLSNLADLKLLGNRLSGPLPRELGRLSNLDNMNLDRNRLTGTIPASFTELTGLRELSFHSNSGLCAPLDATLQAWLEGRERVHGSSCAPADSQEDRAVLTKVYNATDGANWENNSNWLSPRPVKESHGVTNDASGRVIGLYLWENRLRGSIPPELGDLSKLEWLDLWGNELSGTIPVELGNLSELRGLYLRDNQLTGCIPAELKDVEFNDFGDVGLPFCAPRAPGAPTVSLTATTTAMVRIDSPIAVTATLSEPVNGFTESDVTVTNGDVSNFSGSDGDSVYTFDVTPNAVGVVTVDIAAGVAQDTDSDGNAAAEQLALGLPYDDDHDGAISGTEVLNAVRDYFQSTLSAEHILDVVRLYFLSLG